MSSEYTPDDLSSLFLPNFEPCCAVVTLLDHVPPMLCSSCRTLDAVEDDVTCNACFMLSLVVMPSVVSIGQLPPLLLD